MKDNDVAVLGTLLNETPENVKTYAEEGTLGEKIEALNLMKGSDVETLKTNLVTQTEEAHLTKLAEQAKKGEMPSELYKVIKGATLEMTEKELAKEYGVEDYTGVKDLVSKAISKNKGQKDDTKMHELTQKITDLQEINTNLVSEKDEAVQSARSEYESKILSRDKTDVVNSIPFDFSDVDEADMEKITGQRKQIVTSVFDAKYDLGFDGDKVVVKDKSGGIVKNPTTLEPLSALDVMKTIPVELGIKIKSPESGGQGGSSSSGNGSVRFANTAEFEAECAKQGILPTSKAGIELWAKRKPQ